MQRHISIGGYTFICTLWLIFFLKRIHTWVNVTEELKVGKALTALFLSVSHYLKRVNGQQGGFFLQIFNIFTKKFCNFLNNGNVNIFIFHSTS